MSEGSHSGSTGDSTHDEDPKPGEATTSSASTILAVSGARAAAAVLLVSALLKFLHHRSPSHVYIEGGLAIALLMTERDGRLQWVRYAVLAWIAWGLYSLVQATSQLGFDRGSLFGLAWAGGLAGLMFDDGDARKTGAFFALSAGGLLAAMLF